MPYLMILGGVEAAILLKWLAMRVRGFFAGRAAKLMSKVVAAHSVQRNVNVAKSELETPA